MEDHPPSPPHSSDSDDDSEGSQSDSPSSEDSLSSDGTNSDVHDGPSIGFRFESKWYRMDGTSVRCIVENVVEEPKQITVSGTWPSLLLKWGDLEIGHFHIHIKGDWCKLELKSSIGAVTSPWAILGMLKMSQMGITEICARRFTEIGFDEIFSIAELFQNQVTSTQTVSVQIGETIITLEWLPGLRDPITKHRQACLENSMIEKLIKNRYPHVICTRSALESSGNMFNPVVNVKTCYGRIMHFLGIPANSHIHKRRSALWQSENVEYQNELEPELDERNLTSEWEKYVPPVQCEGTERDCTFVLIFASILAGAFAAAIGLTNPARRENWFLQLEDIVFMFIFVVFALTTLCWMWPDFVRIRLQESRYVGTWKELKLANPGRTRQQLLESAAWNRGMSNLLNRRGMSFKTTEQDGSLRVDSPVYLSAALKGIWKFGRKEAFNVLLRTSYPYSVRTFTMGDGRPERVITIHRNKSPKYKGNWFIGGKRLVRPYYIR